MSDDSNQKLKTDAANRSLTDDSDSDSDPFDFVAQFKKLKKNKINENIVSESKIKGLQSNTRHSTVLRNTISTDYINSIISKPSTENNASNSQTVVNLRRGRSKNVNSEVNSTTISSVGTSQVTGNKIVGRKPSGNSKKRSNNSEHKILGPVICIGDFDDGYDMPSPKLPAPKVSLKSIEADEENDYCYELLNRVMNVKVYWRKMRTHRFPIRMFQSIESIYEHFAKLEDINTSHVSLVLNEKPIFPTDSPHSINYKVSDFIDGDIVFYISPYDTPKITKTEEEKKFRIKQKDVKHPIFMSLKKTDKMWVLYLKLAEKLGLDVESFTLEFDGERIKRSDDFESLDLDGDECFELFKKNK